jgi:hypothetical protein
MTHQPYLYKLTQKSTGRWYVGSRTAKNCKPDEKYICSSRHVLPLYKTNKEDWTREILVIGPPDYIRDLEAKYLCLLDAKHDKNSFNLHNGDGKFTTTGKKLKSNVIHLLTKENQLKKAQGTKRAWTEGLYNNRKKLFGDKNPSKRLEVRQAISKALTGKQGGRMTGKTHSPETKAKMAESRRLYWANRKENV